MSKNQVPTISKLKDYESVLHDDPKVQEYKRGIRQRNRSKLQANRAKRKAIVASRKKR